MLSYKFVTINVVIVSLIMFAGLSAQDQTEGWTIYDGTVMLDEADPSWGSGGSPFYSPEIITDENATGGAFLRFLNPEYDGLQGSWGKSEWTLDDFDMDPETGMTVAWRARTVKEEVDGTEEESDRAFEIRIRNGMKEVDIRGVRGDDGKYYIELNRTPAPPFPIPGTLDEWRVFRATFQDSTIYVYVDEHPVPIAEGVSPRDKDLRFRIGDNTDDKGWGDFDWLAWDISGAYAPGEGTELPDTLVGIPAERQFYDEWVLYDGTVMPNQAGPTWTWSDDHYDPEIIEDVEVTSGSFLRFFNPEFDPLQGSWGKCEPTLNNFVMDPGVGITVVWRARAVHGYDIPLDGDTTYSDRPFDIRLRNGAYEVDVRARHNEKGYYEIELNRTTAPRFRIPGDLEDWRVFRATFVDSTVYVYVDEDPEPIAWGVSSREKDSFRFRIGDNTDSPAWGDIDWLAWNTGGAFAPEEGAALPEERLVGIPAERPFFDEWWIYDGTITPDEAVPAWSSGGSPFYSPEIVDDVNALAGDNSLLFYNPDYDPLQGSWGKSEWTLDGFNMDPYVGVTVAWRAKPYFDADTLFTDRAFEVRIRNKAYEVDVRGVFNETGDSMFIELNRTAEPLVHIPGDFTDYRVFRATFKDSTVTVYVDEDPEPLVVGISTRERDSARFRIGDNTDSRGFGYLDWIAWNTGGAFAPGAGAPLDEDIVTSVEQIVRDIPEQHQLYQNYPNPFNPSTVIRYSIPEYSQVRVDIYNMLGQHVTTLVNEELSASTYEVTWNASNVSSGMYFYRIEAVSLENPSNRFIETRKLMFIK